MEWSTQLEVLAEVALAIFLGGLIGYERELADKPAGMRTHMLVAAAAALFVGLGDALLYRFRSELNVDINSDPIRVIEAIVTGISFLGAGTIFRRARQEQVEGLTTAAALLLSSAIGISVAVRQFILAIGVTLLSLIVLRGVGAIERRIADRRHR